MTTRIEAQHDTEKGVSRGRLSMRRNEAMKLNNNAPGKLLLQGSTDGDRPQASGMFIKPGA
jgi:hypothetical protein